MNIAIIKYNAGNVCSVVNAFQRLGVTPLVTDDAELIQRADGVVFPGQGEASKTMQYLQSHGMDQLIFQLSQPVLGICIGMQLLCAFSEEGNTPCIGVFPDVKVHRFAPQRHEDKIPHMGWDMLTHLQSPLFDKVDEGNFCYFIHSYYVPPTPYTIALNDYVQPFSAALRKDNFYATQFHPEKSGPVGQQILQNFLHIVQSAQP